MTEVLKGDKEGVKLIMCLQHMAKWQKRWLAAAGNNVCRTKKDKSKQLVNMKITVKNKTNKENIIQLNA